VGPGVSELALDLAERKLPVEQSGLAVLGCHFGAAADAAGRK
jgi:hypothetical protein